MTEKEAPADPGGDRPRGESVPFRSPSVAWQSVDGEMVLLRFKERELLGLSEVGRRIWEMADGSRSIDAMVASLVSEYSVAPERAAADLLAFIEEMIALGALRLSGKEPLRTFPGVTA